MRYKGIELDQRLAPVVRHMDAVEEYREVLQNLQAVWDNLTLLGQMSGTSTDMDNTRRAFSELTGTLIHQLGSETLNKCAQEMKAKAQVVIDILVRNLFERTADIGFLATDDDIRRFVVLASGAQQNFSAERELRPQREALRRRFAEYVAKYSVYFDIVLLDVTGNVLVRLDDGIEIRQTRDPLLQAALETESAYVETYGRFDLLPDVRNALTYSYRVVDDAGTPIGVLCLCFHFENEIERIFANLATPDDWSVILLVDADGRVIASSDGAHIPVGAKVERITGEEHRIVRFAGNEYLAVSRATAGYQGYMGPGWYGHVMLPVQHAFNNNNASDALAGIERNVVAQVMESPTLFGDALRNIPLQADRVQRDLNRSVWNGNVRQNSTQRAINPAFSKVLLREISNIGRRTKEVFSRSIDDLHQTVVSSILQDTRFIASLAIDIMDRNLYERANDCRWWALNSAFREMLDAPSVSNDGMSRMTEILQTINGLYTVYSNLIVFDAQGRTMAVSQPTESHLVGNIIPENWVKHVLALPDSQGYAVSSFSATPLYDNRHTYIYGAAIRSPDDSRVVGGVGIVFDSEPQFRAMLSDALPRDASGNLRTDCFGAFVDRSGSVIACTDATYRPGDRLTLTPEYFDLASGAGRAGIVRLGGRHYAVGATMASGYREYKDECDAYRNDVVALVFVPLCDVVAQLGSESVPPMPLTCANGRAEATGGETVDIASILIGRSWLGVRASQVLEALDYAEIADAPDNCGDFVGYLMYKGRPIPVYDVRHAANAGPARQGTQRQIIVLGGDDTPAFGIVADDLGEVHEVPASQLQPMPAMLGGDSVLGEIVVNPNAAKSESLLGVISIERIAARLRATPAAAPPSASMDDRREQITLVHSAASGKSVNE